MKAAFVPAANSRWEVRQTETPEPGPSQVLIETHASGLCYTDVHQTRGELPGDFPRTLGHEPVGEIVAVGAGVRTRRTGQPHRRSVGSAYVRPLRVVRPDANKIAGLRPDGRLVLMGFENKPLPLHPDDLITRRIRVLGSQQNSREYLDEALQIAATGKVKVMTETYALDEIATAYERVEQGKVRFRAVITVGD